MYLVQMISQMIVMLKGLLIRKNKEVEPRDILVQLLKEVEKRKKHGIEENAFVPNSYVVYLCPFDYEEIYPLLAGVREQLKSKLDATIKKKGYKLLSNAINLEIREDANLMKSQIVIKSLFIKPKSLMQEYEKNISPEKNPLETKTLKEIKDFKVILPEQPMAKKEDVLVDRTQEIPEIPLDKTFSDEAEETKVANDIVQDEPEIKKRTQIICEKETKYVNPVRVKLELLTGDRSGNFIPLQDGEHTFGRGRQARYLIQDLDETVSRVHFKIVVKEHQIRIWDMNSLNGTKVNDVDVEEAELSKGDVIAAGKILLRVA